MLNIQTPPPKQVLLRLPEDVEAKLVRAVPPRRRNQYLVDLVRRELDKEDAELVAACEYMNQIEAFNPELVRETQEWVTADLAGSVHRLANESGRLPRPCLLDCPGPRYWCRNR